MKHGRRSGEVDVTYVQKEGRARYVNNSNEDGWKKCTLTLLWAFTFLCGFLGGTLVGAGTCSDLDSQGWGQWNTVQAAVSMWRTSQNPWVQLLAPGAAQASAAGALSFVGVGVSGVAYLMKMPGLGRIGLGMIRRYETSTAMNTQLTPVKRMVARMTAGSPLVAFRNSLTREREIPGVRDRVDHRSPPHSQQTRLWEGREQGESVSRTMHGDCDEADQDLTKYIMIPHHRRSAGSNLLAPQASLPRGLVETYNRSPRELAMVPFRRAPGWVRLVDESA